MSNWEEQGRWCVFTEKELQALEGALRSRSFDLRNSLFKGEGSEYAAIEDLYKQVKIVLDLPDSIAFRAFKVGDRVTCEYITPKGLVGTVTTVLNDAVCITWDHANGYEHPLPYAIRELTVVERKR